MVARAETKAGSIAGSLRATPFAAVLVELLGPQKTGTLRILDGQGQPQELIRIEAGLPVAARVLHAEASLMQGLVPLCARVEGDYAFVEGSDQVGHGADVVVGRIDPLSLITAAMRGPGASMRIGCTANGFGAADTGFGQWRTGSSRAGSKGGLNDSDGVDQPGALVAQMSDGGRDRD